MLFVLRILRVTNWVSEGPERCREHNDVSGDSFSAAVKYKPGARQSHECKPLVYHVANKVHHYFSLLRRRILPSFLVGLFALLAGLRRVVPFSRPEGSPASPPAEGRGDEGAGDDERELEAGPAAAAAAA